MTAARPHRKPKTLLAVVALAGAASLACGGAIRPRPEAVVQAAPVPDVEAIREATRLQPAKHYVSALAYRHYVDALLAKSREDLTGAAASLREALLFDPESPHLRTVLAEIFLRLGRVADAEEELRLALSLDGGHGPARVMAAQIASAARRDDEARGHLAAALQADPDDGDALRESVRLEVSRGQLPAARNAAERLAAAARRALETAAGARRDEESGAIAVDLRGADWQAHHVQMLAAESFVDLARAHAAARDDLAAADEFSRATSLAPGEEAVLAAQAAFLESRRKLPEARDVQLRILARRPDAPEAVAALGRLSLQASDPDAAIAYAGKLRQLAADLAQEGGRDDDRREVAQAAFRLGIPLLSAQRAGEALLLFEAGLSLLPGNNALQFYRAVAMGRTGRATEAAALFDELALAPASASGTLDVDRRALALDARIQAALARSKAGQLADALRRLTELLREHPTEESVGVAVLEAFERAGRAGEAVVLLSSAVGQHPRSQALLFALANAQDRAGDRPSALGTMRRLLALDPHHAGALNYVGYALAEKGTRDQLLEAERLLRRASALRPDDGAVADSLGFCLLRLGQTQEALIELARATRLTPDDPVILGHLGDALVALGRKDEAAAAFRRALSDLRPRRAAKAPEPSDAEARVEPIEPQIPRFDAHGEARPTRADGRSTGRSTPRADLQPERLPEPGDSKVRAELEAKLRSLTAR